MNILFICGTIELGKNGVGDYTSRLAGEIIRQGHNASVVAVHDLFINELLYFNILDEEIPICGLRIPQRFKQTKKIEYLKLFIESQNPDWVSIQFVPFSFHSKGIPYNLGALLYPIINNYRIHIMFHELWIGTHGGWDLKTIFWKSLQKYIIKRLIVNLQPELVTTTIKKYLQLLSLKNAELLPLFGNIPILVNVETDVRPEFLKVIIYGSVTSCLEDFKEQILWLNNLSLNLGKKLLFIFIGNNGLYKSKAEAIIENVCGTSVLFSVGFVSKDIVSYYLVNSDFGISRADHTYFGKSGTTITMLEHGLPVLLKGKRPSLSTQVDYVSVQHQLFYPHDPVPKSIIKYPKRNFITSITNQYLQFLLHATSR